MQQKERKELCFERWRGWLVPEERAIAIEDSGRVRKIADAGTGVVARAGAAATVITAYRVRIQRKEEEKHQQ